MKKYALAALFAFTFQAPKPIVVTFDKEEAATIYKLVDDAALPGEVRKPILKKINDAYLLSIDSTKH
jgi:hypothetical protein